MSPGSSTRSLKSTGSPYANNGDLRPRAGNGSPKITQAILGRAGLAATLCPPSLPSLHLALTPNRGQLACRPVDLRVNTLERQLAIGHRTGTATALLLAAHMIEPLTEAAACFSCPLPGFAFPVHRPKINLWGGSTPLMLSKLFSPCV